MAKKIDRFEMTLRRRERMSVMNQRRLEIREKMSERRNSFRSLYNEYVVPPKNLKEKRNLNLLEFFKQDWADLINFIKKKYAKKNN